MKKIPSTVRALPRAERKTPLGRAGRDMGEKTDGAVTRQSARALWHAPARAAILLKTDDEIRELVKRLHSKRAELLQAV